jgi:hypothetical protein
MFVHKVWLATAAKGYSLNCSNTMFCCCYQHVVRRIYSFSSMKLLNSPFTGF